jgi:hypothetical protein
LSFAAAAFVLLAVVNADAQPPATSSVVIPPIPPGQARIWVYSGSQPASPFVRLMPPQTARTAIAQLAFLGDN